ncbi:hypothetical protein GCM10010174_75040 [Kutzneria viridogrisea]|uniref:N-acetyltransferase domain-containing protein n=2 Tax=Kutzneria TaxID=43356 RepID=W5W6F9_9PSEU|nr:hypothetical protein [Kutzneria albida]AHH96492.1 hypothetical protein KALB_3125 [Kutzneria albida DSM 43870]MBA8928290.1 hypothetical protein [Kutzneria viridogrisea]
MSTSIEIHRESTEELIELDLWPNGAVATVLETEGEQITGSVILIDLGAEDPALKIIAVPDVTTDNLVPLMREAAGLAREAGGTVLRWIAEQDEGTAQALAELGATQGEELGRTWQADLLAEWTPQGSGAVVELPIPEDSGEFSFFLGLNDAEGELYAEYGVEVEGDTASLVHNRDGEGTTEELAALVSAVLTKLKAEHSEVQFAETFAATEDEQLARALTSLGFSPVQVSTVEFLLPLS